MAKTLGLQPIGFLEQVSTKWLSRLSAITETPISHGNFSLEIKYKISKKGTIDRTSFCHRNKLLYHKKIL